jgi:hypothetical protein
MPASLRNLQSGVFLTIEISRRSTMNLHNFLSYKQQQSRTTSSYPSTLPGMKLAILFSFLTSTYAFVAAPQRLATKTTSSLSAATPVKNRRDDWSDKPIPERKSTQPAPEKIVNNIQRAMMKDVVIDPDYFITWAVALLGPLILWYHPCKCFDDFHISHHNDPAISESFF